MEKSGKSNALGWITSVAGKKKLYILVLILVNMAQGACSVGMAVALKNVVDDAVRKDEKSFVLSLSFAIALTIGQILLGAISKYINEYTFATLENVFKSRLFHQLLKKDYASVTAKHSGEWMNRLTSDAVVVSDGLTHILPGLTGMLVRLIGALTLIMIYLPKIAYIIIPGGAIILLITYGIRKIMKKIHKLVQEADGRMRVFLQENLISMMVVRAFAKEEQTVNQAKDKMNDHKKARIKRNVFSNLCNIGFAVVMNGVYLVCVGYCCHGILNGNISYGVLMAVIQLVGQIQAPLASITGVLPKYYAMIASAERLMEVESYNNEIESIKDSMQIAEFYNKDLVSLFIENGSFSYNNDGEELTLKDINIGINKGEFVALTGPSGCGKSTLLKLLMCLYPLNEGKRGIKAIDNEIVLDGSYKKLFAYVPQGNHLMEGTIAEVVTFFDEEAKKDKERIEKALQIACADEFVSQLPEGMDAMLGERGCGLSEGQMQRIAIARAVFTDCPVILLDEATSALDEATEKQVLKNIREMTDKTVVIVTHRPAALEVCDRRIEL